MSERNTFARSLHDLGLGAWFGGSLMGVIGLNGAAADEDTADRDRVSTNGWAKWTPVNAAAIAAHLIGGTVILAANARRVQYQRGVDVSTAAKLAATGAAMAATAYTRVLGKRLERATEPEPGGGEGTEDLMSADDARRQMHIAQWAVPALTGVVMVLNSLHGEQQRPEEQRRGILQRVTGRDVP
ncbi:hypothetical protein CUT44_23325 [Streptomyces carminius]|uniref:ABC-type Mn/Zn transport systems, ATPase component n=1 Tax=Streptomyces carminius TaxID=2665496 RepID=A0A2M8LTH7_9ACTN|nr:hypothetical protein [Streptomyces carminius]PJE95257.1 hypothetical protein CUT44_23325 [Streptomyces carminius]